MLLAHVILRVHMHMHVYMRAPAHAYSLPLSGYLSFFLSFFLSLFSYKSFPPFTPTHLSLLYAAVQKGTWEATKDAGDFRIVNPLFPRVLSLFLYF